MITTVAVLFLVSGLVIFLLSLPLLYRKVGMNALYGIRIPRALESEQRWYDINAYGGRQLARWSWLVTGCGAAGFVVPNDYLLVYALVGLGVVVAAILVPTIRILIWSRNHSS